MGGLGNPPPWTLGGRGPGPAGHRWGDPVTKSLALGMDPFSGNGPLMEEGKSSPVIEMGDLGFHTSVLLLLSGLLATGCQTTVGNYFANQGRDFGESFTVQAGLGL